MELEAALPSSCKTPCFVCFWPKNSRSACHHVTKTHPDSCPRQSGKPHGGTVDMSKTESGSVRQNENANGENENEKRSFISCSVTMMYIGHFVCKTCKLHGNSSGSTFSKSQDNGLRHRRRYAKHMQPDHGHSIIMVAFMGTVCLHI